MAFIQGGSLRVKIDTKELMYEVDFTFGIESNMLDLANKDNPLAKSPGQKEYPISLTAWGSKSSDDVQVDLNALAAWADAQSVKAVELTDGVTGNFNFTGTAYLSNFNFTSTVNEVPSCTCTLSVVTGTVGTTA